MPLDRLLVETDAPYLAPVPFRGKRNEPAWVAHTANVLAEVRGMTPEALAELTTANFRRLFRKTVCQQDGLKVTLLGVGASAGVPMIGGADGSGDWGDCDPTEPRNWRSRSSIVIEVSIIRGFWSIPRRICEASCWRAGSLASTRSCSRIPMPTISPASTMCGSSIASPTVR